MREPAQAPPIGFRRDIPIRAKLRAALRAAGFDPNQPIEWHHDPPLQMRVFNPVTRDTEPTANDDRYIVPMQKNEHRARTVSHDIPEIAKTKRLSAAQEAARARMLQKQGGVLVKPASRWPRRKMNGQRPPASVDDIERGDGGD